jgi:tRNA nucleotidyltransferase (CCA-adding enzyme)
LESLTLAQAKKISRKLGLSKKEEEKIISCRKINRSFIRRLSSKRITPGQVFVLLKPLSYEAIIFLRSVSQDGLFKKHIADFLKLYNGLRLCISGDDLFRLGITPGPKYRKILSRVLAARLNGKINSRQEELALARKLAKSIT